MANRRMFSKAIISCDAFVDMPLSTQALYFHLGMHADDEGFVSSPKSIQRVIGASEDDLKVLIMKGFVIMFQSGVIVITHWKMHNLVRKDRFTPTIFQSEKALLEEGTNKVYALSIDGTKGYLT